jgi:hypothetical protein
MRLQKRNNDLGNVVSCHKFKENYLRIFCKRSFPIQDLWIETKSRHNCGSTRVDSRIVRSVNKKKMQMATLVACY